MRLVSAPVALLGLLLAGPAYADCIGPLECFCSFTSTTPLPVGIGTVTALSEEEAANAATVDIESVHAAEGVTPDVAPGDRRRVFVERGVEVGDRLLFYLGDTIGPWAVVRERDDGSVTCGGFGSDDLTLTDLVEVRTSADCTGALAAKDVEYTFPECNDVIEGPFACDASGPEAVGGVAALFGLLGLLRRRRRRG